MKAIQMVGHSHELSVLQWAEVTIPQPGSQQIRVKVKATGVNFADIYQRQGRYPMPAPLPMIPGMEVAGVIDAVGTGVTQWQPGQRVMAWLTHGGYADYALVPVDQAIAIPESLSDAQATALLVQGLTAVGLLRTGTYETVLATAATGGVGGLLVQVALNQGKRVIAAVGSHGKKATAQSLGADTAISYVDADWVEQVRQATDGRGVDAVFDANGGLIGEQSLLTLRPGGTAIMYGSASGEPARFTTQQLIPDGLLVRGYNVYADVVNSAAFLAELLTYLQKGTLSLPLHTYPFEQAHDALAALESRQTQGKVVLLH